MAADLMGIVVRIEGVGAGDALRAVVGGQSVNDGLFILVGTGGEAGVLSGLQGIAHQHGGVIGQRGKHVGHRLAIGGLVVGLELSHGLGTGGVAGAVDGASRSSGEA